MGYKAEIILLVAVPIALIVLWKLLSRFMGKRILRYYTRWKMKKIRKKNPCYQCPSSRKYVCDGCYVKLRREYEDGQRE